MTVIANPDHLEPEVREFIAMWVAITQRRSIIVRQAEVAA